MAVAAKQEKKQHYLIINQLGQSADRRGAFFETEEDAIAWADKHYSYPAWVIPAVPCGKAKHHKLLDRDGNQIQPEG